MSSNSIELPWNGNNPPSYANVPESQVISEAYSQLEHLLQQRKKLICPNDDIDTYMLSKIQCAMDSIKSLIEQDLTEIQKPILIRKSRRLIKEANNIIEKTLKIRS